MHPLHLCFELPTDIHYVYEYTVHTQDAYYVLHEIIKRAMLHHVTEFTNTSVHLVHWAECTKFALQTQLDVFYPDYTAVTCMVQRIYSINIKILYVHQS